MIGILLNVSCNKNKFSKEKKTFDIIKTDYSKWWSYYSKNIKLSYDFIPIDIEGDTISKEHFLKTLINGNTIPVKVNTNDSTYCYKLFGLNQKADKDIIITIKQIASHTYKLYEKEGSLFTSFNFTDLNGNVYTNENTRGKVVVLKCWFIGCKSCVAEFSDLNKLVELNKNRNDIIFISLAFDASERLELFLKENPFKYGVVPNQKKFIQQSLGVEMYPTHFLIDKEGKIKKIVNNANELIFALEGRVDKIKFAVENDSLPPPPPPPLPATK
jgi:peroxiredoxin